MVSHSLAGVRAVLERHGGTVEEYPGDVLMAVFGVPLLHEDDALRAVRAAAELRQALPSLAGELAPELGVRLGARVGAATGEVIAERGPGGRLPATGETVNAAKRLEELAGSDEILVDRATLRLVRESVTSEPAPLDGPAGEATAFRLQAICAPTAARARPHLAAGRARPAARRARGRLRRRGQGPRPATS